MNESSISDLLSIIISGSDAMRIYMRIEILKTNFFVYQKNYFELLNNLSILENPEKIHEIWAKGQEDKLAESIREIIRLFHNYVSATKTLIDHERCFMNQCYKGTIIFQEYTIEVNQRFVNNPLNGFIEEIRNYVVHYDYPISIFRLLRENIKYFNSVDDPPKIWLFRDDLLSWGNWIKGKPYLINAPTKIMLTNIIDQHYLEIHDFNSWIINKMNEFHKDDLLWLSKMTQLFLSSLPISTINTQ